MGLIHRLPIRQEVPASPSLQHFYYWLQGILIRTLFYPAKSIMAACIVEIHRHVVECRWTWSCTWHPLVPIINHLDSFLNSESTGLGCWRLYRRIYVHIWRGHFEHGLDQTTWLILMLRAFQETLKLWIRSISWDLGFKYVVLTIYVLQLDYHNNTVSTIKGKEGKTVA